MIRKYQTLLLFIFFSVSAIGQDRFTTYKYKLVAKYGCGINNGDKEYRCKNWEDIGAIVIREDHSFSFFALVEESSLFATGTWTRCNDSTIELNWDARKTADIVKDTCLVQEYERCYPVAYGWVRPEKIERWLFVRRGDMLVPAKRKD